MALGSGGRRRRWMGGIFAVVAVGAVVLGGRMAGLWTLPGLDEPAPPVEDLPLSTQAPPGARRLAPFVGGPVLVRLPSVQEDRPGTLLGDVNGTLAEKHAYRVRVPYALAVGETEVTFAHWDQCVREKGCPWRPGDNGWGRGRRPVVQVSWDDIQKYLLWANRKAGLEPASPHRLRLLTEAEWEYAARAGNDGEYSLGPSSDRPISPSEANYDSSQQHRNSPVVVPRRQTLPVRSFAPNAFGLYDMHGNVWEWLQDTYGPNEYARRQAANGWLASQANEEHPEYARVLRGGSWNVGPHSLRSMVRGYSTPNNRMPDFGFRIAQTLP